MFMLGTGFFFFCFLIAIGYFLYKYFSHFGVNIVSVTFLIFIISSFVLPKLWNAGVNSPEQFVLEYQNEK